ncbi:MAG TPA: restriction endonuclease subunit S [Hanamia sp.]|nr:restriction endonuclease subunit S [Hanamia sp.]
MQVKLSHIVIIQTGLFAKTMVDGDIAYLQSKDFDENGHLNFKLEPELKEDRIAEKHLLEPGDVLFASKGTKNFAAIYEHKNIPAVASTSFFVIRIKEDFKEKVLPEYLLWFMNQPVSQKFLKGNAIGTSMVSIPKSVLGELEIFIPGIEKQKAILEINNLHNKEKNIKKEIDSLIDQKIQQQIFNSLK